MHDEFTGHHGRRSELVAHVLGARADAGHDAPLEIRPTRAIGDAE